MKYRKKPVVIEAVQYTGDFAGRQALRKFCSVVDNAPNGDLCIDTLEGIMTISPNDWLIKGTRGEFYPCKPDVFSDVYEFVD